MSQNPRLAQLLDLWRDARTRGDPELAELTRHSRALEFPDAASAALNQTQTKKEPAKLRTWRAQFKYAKGHPKIR
jgi:hypothetical protein